MRKLLPFAIGALAIMGFLTALTVLSVALSHPFSGSWLTICLIMVVSVCLLLVALNIDARSLEDKEKEYDQILVLQVRACLMSDIAYEFAELCIKDSDDREKELRTRAVIEGYNSLVTVYNERLRRSGFSNKNSLPSREDKEYKPLLPLTYQDFDYMTCEHIGIGMGGG